MKIVPENITNYFISIESLLTESEKALFEKAKLALSAGLVVLQDNKMLLVHPTNSKWWNSYSIPKGHVDPGEDIIDAAIRETYEETGIIINRKEIVSKNPDFVNYVGPNGKLFKRVYYFVAKPIKPIKKNDIKLQLDEVDYVSFFTFKEAQKRISRRFKHLLKYLN